jgi:hypothetical protein
VRKVAENADTYASLNKGSYYYTAKSRRFRYSIEIAHFYRMLVGSLKYTGTDNFVKSYPILSLIIVQKDIFFFGSLK